MRPDFTKIDWKSATAKREAREAEEWLSSELIALKSFYTREDLAGLEHLQYAAGIPPYLRGPRSTMHAMRPWTIRQHTRFSTAEESNAFYRRNVAAGARTFGGVGAGDAARLRLRSRARDRRRGQGGRGHRLNSRHEDFVPPHSAGADFGIDTNERRGAADHGVLYCRCRGAGRGAGAVEREHPERHFDGVHGPQYVHLSARGIDADYGRYPPLLCAEDAEIQLHQRERLPDAGSGRDRGFGACIHACRRARVFARGGKCRS